MTYGRAESYSTNCLQQVDTLGTKEAKTIWRSYKTLTDNQLTESNFQRISQHLLKTSFQNFAYIRRHNDMMQRLLSYTLGLQEMRQKSPWQSNKSSKCLKQKETWGKSCDLQSFLLTKRYIKTNRWASLVHGTNQSKK